MDVQSPGSSRKMLRTGGSSDESAAVAAGSRSVLYAILLAQVLSVALATTGVSSQALTNQGVYAPTTQAFFNYCLLALVFGTTSMLVPYIQHRRRQQRRDSETAAAAEAAAAEADALEVAAAATATDTPPPSQLAQLWRSWPSFAALALIDVEANVLVTKAYQYTSLTSVTLLDCFTIPCVMVLSWLILGSRYKGGHYAGAVCCIAGLAVLVLGDSKGSGGSSGNSLASAAAPGVAPGVAGTGWLGFLLHGSSSSSGSSPLLGDALVLLGAVLYGVCNVTQELLLSDVQPGQLLALLGFFGALISGAQAVLLEHAMLVSVHWASASVLLPMAGFALAMLTFYSIVPQVLMLGGATVLNLGLLTSDGWAALARYLWFGGFEGWSAYFFVGSLLLVAGGLAVFTLSGSPKSSSSREGASSGSGVGGRVTPVAYSRLQGSSGDVEDQQAYPPQPQLASHAIL